MRKEVEALLGREVEEEKQNVQHANKLEKAKELLVKVKNHLSNKDIVMSDEEFFLPQSRASRRTLAALANLVYPTRKMAGMVTLCALLKSY